MIILFLKGILVGIGKIIPGVSGALIAISLKIYEPCLKAISTFFKDIKNNTKLLLPIGLGIIFSIFIFSKIIINLLNTYYLSTMLLFIGLIIGSISNNKIKYTKNNIFIFIIILIITLLLSLIKQENNYNYSFIILIIMGFIEAITMIVPGLSGTALLMLLGYYNTIISAYSMIDLKVLIPFILGLIIGVIIISKIMSYLFKHYQEKIETAIYSLSVSSIIILLLQTLKTNYPLNQIIISLILLVIGYNISKSIEKNK